MKRLTPLAIAIVGLLTVAPSVLATTTVPAATTFPESVAVQPGTSNLFVSSFLTGAVVKDKLGAQARPFLPAGAGGRTSATGLAVDKHGRLFVLTGAGHQLQVFNARTGRRLADFAASPRAKADFNDLAISKQGDVYITSDATPLIYRLSAAQLASRRGQIKVWLSPRRQIVNLPGLNLNGIAVTPDGRYLLVDQTSNGALYRVDIATKAIVRVEVSRGSLTGCDGILLRGSTLYVTTHSNTVPKLELNKSFRTGRVVERITNPTFDFPTSIKQLGNKLVITNALKVATATSYQLTILPGGS